MLALTVWDFVHRIIIIATKKKTNRHPSRLQRPKDRIMNQRPAQRTHMRPPRRRLRVIDYLRTLKLLHQLITPKHQASVPTKSQQFKDTESHKGVADIKAERTYGFIKRRNKNLSSNPPPCI